jgi:diguanylate cyclase (GGDEF)-like protein/PAS domain S-box-containing protein
LQDWIVATELLEYTALLRQAPGGNSRGEVTLSSGGVLIPVQLSISAVRLAGKDAYACIVTDLTEQKLGMLVLEQAIEAIIVCGSDGRIIRASQTAITLCENDLINQPFVTAFPLMMADNSPYDIRHALRGKRIQCEATLEFSGRKYCFLVNAGPLAGRQQNLLGCIVTMTDITARKIAQQALLNTSERYRSLVLATTQIVWIADPDGRPVDDIPDWRRYTGQSEAEIRGHGWARALHQADFQAGMGLWLNALATGTMFIAQFRVRRYDGAYRYHIMRGVPVLTENGEIREWISTVTDIHEQQQTELRMILEHGVARLLAESVSLADTMIKIIRLICNTYQWDCGMRWTFSGQVPQVAESWRANILRKMPSEDGARGRRGHRKNPRNPNRASYKHGIGRATVGLDALPAAGTPAAGTPAADALAHEVIIRKEPMWVVDIYFDHGDQGSTTRETTAYPKDDRRRPSSAFAFPVLDNDHAVGAFGFFSRDMVPPDHALLQTVTVIGRQIGLFLQRKQTESVLLLRNRALGASTEAIFIARCINGRNEIEYVNPAFEKITGYPPEQVLGQDLFTLEQTLSRDQSLVEIHNALRERRAGHAITQNYRPDGSRFWSDLHIAPVRDERGKYTHFIGIQNDISQSMHYQNALEYQANHDALTGLPNRNLLNDRLQRAIGGAQRNENLMAIVFVDLDHFKLINDTLGHDVGDLVLKTIATRLVSCLRDADTAARPGGDEFLLILVDQESNESISIVIRRILDMIAQPIPINGRDLYVTCSIGISIYLQDGNDVSTLLKNADTAMYHAKELGRNNFQFFNNAMNLRVHERFMLESALRQAIVENNLSLHYQPQIDIRTGRMIGMEALLRWRHPQLGMIEPSKFIPIAEESGLIISIGEWVLRTACAQNKAWQEAGLPAMNMAVNLSARQFKHEKLTQLVANVLAETGLAAEYLELELTESLALEDSRKFMLTLNQLKALGLQLTIDDFGTGYSSLSYLKHLPLDRLKIDISFVNDIVTNTDDAAIAQTIVMLGHSLKLKVIAEGVETRAQLAMLQAQGCDEIQGFFFSKPLPAEGLEALLRSADSPHNWGWLH